MQTRSPAWMVSVVGLAVGIVVAAVLGFWQLSVKNQTPPAPIADNAQIRDQVTDVVTETVPRLLSFAPDTSRGDVDAVVDELTGSAVEDYRKRVRTRAQGVTIDATVRNTGVEALTDDHAQVVAFVDLTSDSANHDATTDIQAYRVSLTKVDDEWLISELEQL